MTDFSLIKCPQFLDNAVTPPAKEIGTTLGNIFYLVFSPVNYNVEKLRIKHLENLKKYQDDIQNELNKIPEENLKEPELSIVGPALEASKYYIEEEEIRKMFAKLIASSLNTSCSHRTHHAFIELIKQLSPLDASNLKIIITNSQTPVARYVVIKENDTLINTFADVFLSNPINDDIITQSSSITNLLRLGLISVNYEHYLADENKYKVFEQHSYYKELCKELEKLKSEGNNIDIKSIKIEKGVILLTPFGKDFVSVCL